MTVATPLPGDTELLARFERHCQAAQPAVCLICGAEGQGVECDTCHLAHDKAVDRAGDL